MKQQKYNSCFGGHANGVVGPYYIYNKAVKEAYYSQILYPYVRSEAQRFSQNGFVL